VQVMPLQRRLAALPERRQVIYWTLLALPLPLFLLSLLLGRYQIAPPTVLEALLSPVLPMTGDAPGVMQTLILRIRLPRILAAMLIGASLAGTGAAFQGIFRNPLVDTNILGVTSGAGFGAALMLLLTGDLFLAQTAAFVFGLVAVSMAYLASRLYKTAPLIVLTLSGILVGSFFGSLTALLKYLADPLDALPAITFWLLGGLTGVTWADVPLLFAITVGGMLFLWLIRWQFNLLSLGEGEAAALGVNTGRLKLLVIVCATLMTAIAVSVGGVIGWVGLVIPHAGRALVGPDHRRLIPACFSLGAVFLLTIDDLSRSLLPSEVPLGVFTGLVGVPVLLLLLRQNKVGWR
jgi:iron complex transport system permease protein